MDANDRLTVVFANGRVRHSVCREGFVMITDPTLGKVVPGSPVRKRAPRLMPRLRSIRPLLQGTAIKWYKDKAIKLSAALSLYAVLALAPILVISLKLFSTWLGPEAASHRVQRQMESLIGHAGAAAINDMLLQAARQNSGRIAAAVSVIILIFTASAVFGELQDSLNTIWNVKARPDISWMETLKNRFLSIAMVFVILFLLLISMFISTGLAAVAHRIAPDKAITAIATDFLISVIVVAILITMLFRFLPDVRIDWRDVFLGALVTAILFKLGQYLLAMYFRFGSTTSAYGAAGSFVAVLLWVYYYGWILVFGAEFTCVYAKSRGRGFEPVPDAVKLSPVDRATQGLPASAKLPDVKPAVAPAKQ
jgi:membrane protein